MLEVEIKTIDNGGAERTWDGRGGVDGTKGLENEVGQVDTFLLAVQSIEVIGAAFSSDGEEDRLPQSLANGDINCDLGAL
jgi:hypothetical protein